MKFDVFDMDTEEIFLFMEIKGWKVTESETGIHLLQQEDRIIKEDEKVTRLLPPRKEIVFQSKDDFADSLQYYFSKVDEDKQNNESMERFLRDMAEGFRNAKWVTLSTEESMAMVKADMKDN